MAHEQDPRVFRLTIPSQTKYLNLVTGLAKRASLEAGLDAPTSSKVAIAVDESVTNVIKHAYADAPDWQIDIEFRFPLRALEICIYHDGVALRQDDLSIPDASEYVRHPRKGGLGLLLMSRFMDELSFQTVDGRHRCCMVKYL